ncbi:hypothetical protein [Tsuneonella amylolytica]|uniref:hypothetical protein n=1 Tax=Tsuneonella amylolytica TaxID=2338327 RepID=UPI001F3AE741|nr:hypothetical protein [Tsuneonella amylolytica]
MPFRLHGRDPATGLDCVGVVAAAFAACGTRPHVPHGYGLRNRSVGALLELAGAAGLADASGEDAVGDILLVRPGPAQHHLLVALSGERYVHAHAGLRRVVIQPGPLPWPVERRWRLAAKETR